MTVRPGARLFTLLFGVAAASIGAVVWMPVAWLCAGAAIAIVLAAVVEVLMLQQIALRAERPAQVALSLGEAEELPLQISHDAPFGLHVLARCRWPEVLGGGSAVAAGVSSSSDAYTHCPCRRWRSRGSAWQSASSRPASPPR